MTNAVAYLDESALGWERSLYAFLAEKQRRSGSMRTVAGYSRMVAHDEEGTLRRYSLITWGLAIPGGIFLAVGIFTAAAAGSRLFWLVVLAALGGFSCGFGMMYSSAVQQWPILRRYINTQLVRDDAEQTQPLPLSE